MIKRIILVALTVFFSIITLSACTNNNEEIKYELVEYGINNSEDYKLYTEEYKYYYIVFNNTNKNCYIEFQKLNDLEDTKTTVTYIETETSYVISMNGTSLEFKKEKMEMQFLMFNFRFKKVD